MGFRFDPDFTRFLVQQRIVPNAMVVMANKTATAKSAVAIIIHMALTASPSTSFREVDEGGVCLPEPFSLILFEKYTKNKQH